MFGSNWTATLDLLHMLVVVEFYWNVLFDARIGPFLATLCKEVMLDLMFPLINNETLDKESSNIVSKDTSAQISSISLCSISSFTFVSPMFVNKGSLMFSIIACL
jgi:hypothetical protein